MTLSAGTRLGPYEILTPIGAGGMGEVYKARDSRIGRDVAIKILPASYSADPDRLRRFEQEARATGVLNHPNVLSIFDVGTMDGTPYLVSELLEGETLRDRLRNGAIPQRKAIDYVLQSARGLSAAHEKGIAHRDLKPENIFITKDGRVKILDFGLAKLTQPDAAKDQVSKLETGALESLPGMVLGTVGYMSPEQVRGRPSDYRSDIFAFGAILYEMLTGKRAFQGETPADTMSAILQKDPPDATQIASDTSPGLQRIISRCLEKEPSERFHSTHDLAFALEAVSGTSSAALASTPATVRKKSYSPVAFFLLGAILSAIIFSLFWSRTPVSSPPPIRRLSVLPPKGTRFSDAPALSPDGKQLAFEAVDSNGEIFLYLRPLDSLTATQLPGTKGAQFICFRLCT